MLEKKVQRQIRYNLNTDFGEQIPFRHKWIFLTINEPREIERIQEKIMSQFREHEDLEVIDDNVISNTNGLHYHAIRFVSNCPIIYSYSQIYNSPNFRHDRDLGFDMNDVDVGAYVERLIGMPL